ncbi:AAA family ATPase [Haloarchaeobius amylolyticus]|uniref:AAA family ATPase n=1 Tax=Haloarchaeobius amylolyticus TaxID=1198296 RepID=A0ABD6BFG9_9EURY
MIVVICGPPGAGKTTIATRVRRRLDARDVPVRLFHSDDFSSRTYEQLAEQVSAAPATGVTLVDGTFYRRRWQTKFRALGDVRFVHVTASLETCLERNRTRRDPIDEQGVHVVYREFETPDADLEVDTDRWKPDAVADRIVAAIDTWGEHNAERPADGRLS